MTTPRIELPFITRLPADKLMQRFPEDMPNTVVAEMLGITRQRVFQLRKPDTMIRWFDADRYAIRLGLHPAEIWGWLWTYEVRPVKVSTTKVPA